MEYTYNKIANIEKLTSEINYALPGAISHISSAGSSLSVFANSELQPSGKTTLDNLIASHTPSASTTQIVVATVKNAINFGNNLIFEFTVENVLLGITQLGLTTHVRRTTTNIITALTTGSLYDAITELKQLDPNDFDQVILTPARLLVFRNKLETYLGIPLSQNWND